MYAILALVDIPAGCQLPVKGVVLWRQELPAFGPPILRPPNMEPDHL
jgi:hypothetical protein